MNVTRLENGLRVVTESVGSVSSAAVGLWVENGSRYESRRLNGISHVIEHLMFKGTPTRSARRIAEEIESLGGSINAFTSKEHACYHARALHEHVERCVDVVSDIFLNSTFRRDDLELERDVVIQEILDAEDSPEDLVHDYYLASYWPGHPLGWPVMGTAETVGHITRNDIITFVAGRYRPDRVILAVAGRVDHQQVVDLCRERFGQLAAGTDSPPTDRPDFHPGVFVKHRDLEQVHIVLGFPGVAYTDPGHEAAEVLITALGGGMSSRLFQNIREERGLAYTVYAFSSSFQDIGYTGIYAATGREHVTETIEVALEQVRSVREQGLSEQELERTKAHITGSIPLARESTENRMLRLARNQMYFGREVPLEEVVSKIQAVTNERVIELARETFSPERMGVALLGDAEEGMVPLPVG